MSEKKNCQKENLKKCASFEDQKVTRFIWGKVYFRIVVFSCLSSTKPCLRFLLICFPTIRWLLQTTCLSVFDQLWRIKFEMVKSQHHFYICAKPARWIYLLQSLRGHSCGRQFFIPDLNESRDQSFSDQRTAFPIF